MDFDTLYDVKQTNDTPTKWQIVRKADNKIMGTYDTIGTLTESIANFRLRIYWTQIKYAQFLIDVVSMSDCTHNVWRTWFYDLETLSTMEEGSDSSCINF